MNLPIWIKMIIFFGAIGGAYWGLREFADFDMWEEITEAFGSMANLEFNWLALLVALLATFCWVAIIVKTPYWATTPWHVGRPFEMTTLPMKFFSSFLLFVLVYVMTSNKLGGE